ncbi:MAG: dynamin family protein, partial [Cyanobacteria bacterium SID2]|nr:dynamin family protein [Cyanobacteria bacterium SID2]
MARYTQIPKTRPTDRNERLQKSLREQQEVLQTNRLKLDRQLLRIAAFGAVSRGKSAVLNALLKQNVLPTGPLHGVTQWPRSILWQVQTPQGDALPLQVELIDTPGLDEVDGAARSQMAREIAQQADAIL